MSQLKFLADLTQGSATVVVAAGVDLSPATGRTCFFTRAISGITYDVGGVSQGGDGRWRVALTAPYGGTSAAAVTCILHFSFSASGIPYPDPTDTEWPAINRRQVAALDSGLAGAQAAVQAAAQAGVSTGLRSNLTIFDPALYGDVSDSAPDHMTALLGAIAAAGNRGGGEVRLRAQAYRLPDNLGTLPPFVWLTGANLGVLHRERVNYGAGQAPLSPTSGTVFSVTAGSGGSDTATAAVTLGQASGISGVSFFYPNQPQNQATPTAYPFAVRLVGYGASVERVEFINAYRGLDVLGAGRCHVKGLTGNPLLVGLRVDNCYDTTRFADCQFVDSFVRGQAGENWFRANSLAYQLLDNDEVFGSKLFSFGYRTGLLLAASTVSGRPEHGSYGVISDSGFDGCLVSVRDEATRSVGMMLVSQGFTPGGAAGGTPYDVPSSRGYLAPSGKTGRTTILHGGFWGVAGEFVRVDGGAVRLLGCFFHEHADYLVRNTVSCTLDVQMCRFTFAGNTRTVSVEGTGTNGLLSDCVLNNNATPVDVANASPFFTIDTAGRGTWSDAGVINVTGAYTLLPRDLGKIHVVGGAGAYGVYLPEASIAANKVAIVQVSGAIGAPITLGVSGGSQLIDGQLTRAMCAGESATLWCDGAGWHKIGGLTIPQTVKLQRQGANQSIPANAITTVLMTTRVSGNAAMFDSAGGRARCIRTGQYAANGFAYATAAPAGGLYVGVSLNGTGNTTAGGNGYNIAVQAGAYPQVLDLTGGATVECWVYASSAVTLLGTAAGTYPQLTLTEVPSW